VRHYADADGGPAVIGRLADLLQECGWLIIATISHQDWRAYISSAVRASRGEADPSGVTARLLSRALRSRRTGHDLGVPP
jgi:tRNA(Met) C34 N-acetyltransferase TmcA